jgi:acyl carrier protein
MNDASKSEADLTSLILGYLRQAAPEQAASLTADAKILEVIDSFSFVEMFGFLEAETKTVIDLSTAEPKDLETVQSFARFLSRT